MKPVPTRIIIRRGLTALPTVLANRSDAQGIKPKPTLPPTRADSLRNFLLLVDIHSLLLRVQSSLKRTRSISDCFGLGCTHLDISTLGSEWIRATSFHSFRDV